MMKPQHINTETINYIDYFKTVNQISELVCHPDMGTLADIKASIILQMNKYSSVFKLNGYSSEFPSFLCSLFNDQEIIYFLSMQQSEIFSRLFKSQNRVFCKADIDIQQKLILYIQKNYNNPGLSVKKIASENYMSVRKLQRHSIHLTCLGPSELLRIYRIIKSCVQIIHTDERLEKIAFDNGFGCYSNFFRTFQNCVQLTPKKFRQEYKYLLYLF